MTWRDNPRIIWQDEDGDHLWHFGGSGGRGDLAIGDGNVIDAAIDAPDSPTEWDELLHRLAAVAGRRITGIEDAPRPIEVGDIVRWEGVVGTYEVRHVDGEQAMVRYPKTGQAYVARLVQLRHVEVEAPEPVPEGGDGVRWIEQQVGTTNDEWAEMIAAALDDGRQVEIERPDGWVPTSATAAGFRHYGAFDLRYRIEAPAEPEVCTDEHRMCTDGDWCCDECPHGELICSRHPGHDGPHVACDPHEDEHNLASWSDGGDGP